MLNIRDWILLKAIFCQELHNAVLAKDKEAVKKIILEHYEYEVNEGFIYNVSGVDAEDTQVTLDSIDLDEISKEHLRAIAEDDFSWAL